MEHDAPPPSSPSPSLQQSAPPPPIPVTRPVRKRGMRWWMWLLLVLLLLGGFLVVKGVISGFASAKRMAKPADQFPGFQERASWGQGEAKVVRIPLEGVIMRGGGGGGLFGAAPDPVGLIKRRIRAATNDKDVRGIILEVNSPGGGVTPSDEIFRAMQRFKEADPTRVVLVHMKDLAASGGYYASMAADYIMAEPTTILGSIGVIMSTYNLKGLADDLGVKGVTIKSGANKDLLNPFKEVDPEQLQILQQMVDAMQQRFVDIVATGREGHIGRAKLDEVADGRIFDAEQARALGLIDDIGYWEEAVAQMETLVGEAIRVVRYERTPTFFESLSQASTPVKLPDVATLSTPRFLYLWRP